MSGPRASEAWERRGGPYHGCISAEEVSLVQQVALVVLSSLAWKESEEVAQDGKPVDRSQPIGVNRSPFFQGL